jgi:hypothetical protein
VKFRRRLLPVATWVVAFCGTAPCFAQDVLIVSNGFNPGTAPNVNVGTTGGTVNIIAGSPNPNAALGGVTIPNSSQFNASTLNTADFSLNLSANATISSAGVILVTANINSPPVNPVGGSAGNIALNSGAVNVTNVVQPFSRAAFSSVSDPSRMIPVMVAQFSTPTFVNVGVPTDKTSFKFNLQSEEPIFGKDKKNNPLLKTLNYTRNPYKPVAAGVPRALPFMQLSAIDRDQYSLRHDGTARLTTNDSAEVGIKSGSIFVVAHEPIVITHNELRVSLGAGAIVHVSASSNCLVVRTLHDKHMKDVNVSFAKESLAVPVGTELCIGTDENAVLEEINKDTMVRRSSLGTKLSSGKFGLTSTFPLHSMLAHPMLVNMYRNRIEDRPHIEKLMRMAACLHLIGRNSH